MVRSCALLFSRDVQTLPVFDSYLHNFSIMSRNRSCMGFLKFLSQVLMCGRLWPPCCNHTHCMQLWHRHCADGHNFVVVLDVSDEPVFNFTSTCKQCGQSTGITNHGIRAVSSLFGLLRKLELCYSPLQCAHLCWFVGCSALRDVGGRELAHSINFGD